MANQIIIDHVIIECNGCHKQTKEYPDAPIVGAEAFMHWMKFDLPRFQCPCGHEFCDLKAHIANPEVLHESS
jgi:hypothetical protein